MIDRERAEGDRLRRASIRRMYARRRWYEDNPDVPKAAERVASLTDEIERAESADDPPEAVVELVHEVLGVD